MAKSNFDYKGALESGYSDQEITEHLSSLNPEFDYESAIEAGYSPQEINEHLSVYEPKEIKKEKPFLEKAARIGTQFALGAAEGAALPYEIGAATLASQDAQEVRYREQLFEDIENFQQMKELGGNPGTGKPWDEQDERHLNSLVNQAKNPGLEKQFVKTGDIGIRGAAEAITGQDLKPEGFLEHAANWAGFIKNPKNAANLAKNGLKAKDVIKAILPTGEEVLRSIGAASALEIAEDGHFGPIGTMAAAIVGDLLGGGVAGVAKSALKPKESLAKVVAAFTPKDKLQLQKDIIDDFRAAGIQADIGTITNNDLIKGVQARLAQSQFTGKPLNEFRDQLTKEIKDQYKRLADGLGEARFQTLHEAGETGKQYIKNIRETEKGRISGLYNKARERLTQNVFEKPTVNPLNIIFSIKSIEKMLKPGAVKSTEQKAVLDVLDRLKSDVIDASGKPRQVPVVDLLNNKIALNDIINYEIQGGQKQLLRSLVQELDNAIISHGAADKEFLKNYAKANKDFAKHSKTFRNDNILRIITADDPMILMNKMNSVQGIKDIENALKTLPEGKKVFDDLKRFKFDQMVGNKMTDNISEQIKFGTFSNLMKNPKDMQIAKELLGNEAFAELMKLQKSTSQLAKTAQKFYNASQSGVTILDAGIVAKGLSDLTIALTGNPWPLAKTIGGLAGARYISKLMADSSFLRMVEEVIKASNKNDVGMMFEIGKRLEQPIRAALMQFGNQNPEEQQNQ